MFTGEPIKVLEDGKFVEETHEDDTQANAAVSAAATEEHVEADKVDPAGQTLEIAAVQTKEHVEVDKVDPVSPTVELTAVQTEITEEVPPPAEDPPKKVRAPRASRAKKTTEAAPVEPAPGPKEKVRTNLWPEVYSSRQNKSILKWPVIAIEEYALRAGEKVLCLVLSKDHRLKGIIPLSETGIKPGDSPRADRIRLLKYIGQEIAFIVIGIDLENDRFIASRKFALTRLSARKWPDLKEDMIVHATARRVYDKGVIVEFDGIEARLPIWEISYGWVEEMADHIQPGDELDVKVINLDRENERVTVSLKALVPNPWPSAEDRYQKNGVYLGKVTGIVNFGVFVELEPGVNALCNHLRTTSKYQAEVHDQVAVQVTDVAFKNGEGRVKGGVIRIVRKAS